MEIIERREFSLRGFELQIRSSYSETIIWIEER